MPSTDQKKTASEKSRTFIATFYTHYGAITFWKNMKAMGDLTAAMIPAPRKLSVSCGTAVLFSAAFNPDTMTDEDTEGVYEIIGDDYKPLYRN